MSTPKIFVIVVTYKGRQWYDKCFTSLRESTLPVEVVVVDNTPGDADEKYIHTHFPEIHIIKPKENLGFGRANNLGMRYALDNGCDFVFLLNQDAWIKSDTLEKLVVVASKNTEFGILSPMHLRPDEKSLYIQIEDGSTDHGNTLLADCYFQNLRDVYPFTYINAAAWLITRNVLETVGGFDPIFFLYGEDDNYLQRLSYHARKVGLVPRAQIIHDHHDVIGQDNDKVLSYREKQSFLVKCTDINRVFNYQSELGYLLRKIIIAILQKQPLERKKLITKFLFLRKNKISIIDSRKQNVLMGKNWL